jgi:capsular polysaccharide transport system permease protein
MIKINAHLSTIQALIVRDIMARFGRNNLGFIWTVLEPMILCSGVMFLWSLMKHPLYHGIPIIMFVTTGYMPLTLWRHLTNPFTRLLSRQKELLYHRPVRGGHIIIAALIQNFLSTTAALVIVYWCISTTGIATMTEGGNATVHLDLLVAGWLFTAWYYGAMGMLLAAWTEYWEPAEKFTQPLQYLALPLSGMFFLVGWLPTPAQKLLLLNPSVHCFEMFRAGAFGQEMTFYYDAWYLAACSTAMTIAGVAALYNVRDRISLN